MKNRMSLFCVAASLVALPFLLAGCDREVSHTSSTSVKSDGSSKSKEEVVRQAPDGTVTKDEVSKKVTSDGTVKSEESTVVKSPDGTVIKKETEKSTTTTTP